jgi:anti-sigma-K factor RskA
MSLSNTRFFELLNAYGADLRRWPTQESQDAATLLAESADARALLQRAQDFDARLALPESDAPSPWLRQRILATAQAHFVGYSRRSGWRDLLAELGGWRLAGPSLAAALTIGIALGLGLGLEELEFEQQPSDLVALLQLDDEDLEY